MHLKPRRFSSTAGVWEGLSAPCRVRGDAILTPSHRQRSSGPAEGRGVNQPWAVSVEALSQVSKTRLQVHMDTKSALESTLGRVYLEVPLEDKPRKDGPFWNIK